MVWNGVTTTDDGRIFVCFPHLEGDGGIRIGELKTGNTLSPYPTASWNNWQAGQEAATAFVRTNSLRIGPDANLWIVDTGTPYMGAAVIENGPKVVVIDPITDQVVRIISLDGVVRTHSLVSQLRITSSHLYLTDAGEPALIILNRRTGQGRRILEGDDSVTDLRPIVAEGTIMSYQHGGGVRIHASQLEVSPDGKYLYFQPASGLMSRLETMYVNDETLSSVEIAGHIQLFVDTPGTGGTTIDADGMIYLSDVNESRLLKITPDGKRTTLLTDDRLTWVDALWLDDAGFLWLPAAQLNRLAMFQQGTSTVDYPVHLFKLQIGSKPVRN
ncbi:L-dopachrome tautomerase-related protein [Spirosoma aerophilum]